MKSYLLAAVLLCNAILINAQTDINDLRTNYNVGETVTITGIVINGDEMGSSVRYIQDATAGVAIYPGAWDTFTEPLRGDEITVTGEITEYNGLLEVGPNLTDVTINSSGNALPDFQSIDPSILGEAHEGELVTFEGAQFQDGGSTFSGGNTYTFLHNGEQAIIYLRSGSALEGEIVPAGQITLNGIVSQFSFDGFGGYQVLPRDMEDFISDSSINLVSQLTQSAHDENSITLNWLTDTPGSSVVYYGASADNLDMTATGDAGVTAHETVLTGLEPGTVYYAYSESANDDSAVQSSISSFVTISNSSGEIKVYFTGSVDTDVATFTEAVSLGALTNDTIAAYIDRAEVTLDLAVYNNNDQTIMNAIDDAYDRGVQIRIVTQGSNANIGLGMINSNIPVLERQDNDGSGMHNKFVIIDADDAAKSALITGSTNFTTNGLVSDYNNVVIFHDQSICRGFRVEFEEMWGGSDAQPVTANAKFSTSKLNNTPKFYTVGGVQVDAYFSPTDGVTAAIEQALQTTDSDLEFALLVLTRDELAEAIIEADNVFIGIAARGMVEQFGGTGSDAQELLDNGVEVESHQGVANQLHHKYCIIDHSNVDSDPQVVTGSHNWSSSAETVNDENTVIIHDADIANQFYQEWHKRWSELTVGVQEIDNKWAVRFFPNPVTDVLNLYVENQNHESLTVSISDVTGKVVFRTNLSQKKETISVSEYEAGIYMMTVTDGNNAYTEKVVIR